MYVGVEWFLAALALCMGVGFCIGVCIGWITNNVRWVQSSVDGDPVTLKRKTYYVVDPTRRR